MRALILVTVALIMTACQSAPVNRPCGVIIDGLRDVRATTPEGNRRINVHHARGKVAGCWQ